MKGAVTSLDPNILRYAISHLIHGVKDISVSKVEGSARVLRKPALSRGGAPSLASKLKMTSAHFTDNVSITSDEIEETIVRSDKILVNRVLIVG